MDLKNHILLECVYDDDREVQDLKIRIAKGMTKSNIKSSMGAKNEWMPGKDERLYFFPGCNVPRFKVREKFSVTIKPEYATSAFISTKTLGGSDATFINDRVIKMNKSLLKYHIGACYGENHHFYRKFMSLADSFGKILMYDGDFQNFKWDIVKNSPYPQSLYDSEQQTGKHQSWDSTEFYEAGPGSKLSDLQCPVYTEDSILKILNEGSMIIDEDKYDELRVMCESADKENIVLVMEIMANSDYDKSFLYLLLLLKEFQTKFEARKREINHVNFKGLLHYFGLDGKNLGNRLEIESMMNVMKKLGRFTRANVQRLTSFYTDARYDQLYETDHFTKGPVLRRDAEHLLDEDIIADPEDIVIPDDEDDDTLITTL